MISKDDLEVYRDMINEPNEKSRAIKALLEERKLLVNILEAADYLVNGPEMFGFDHKEILKELIKEVKEL